MSKYSELVGLLEDSGVLQLEDDWAVEIQKLVKGAPRIAAPVPPAGDVDFWDWLDQAYRNGSQGDQPKFTKYNMEVAFAAGISAAEKNVEPVAPDGAAFVKPTILKETNVAYAASSGAPVSPAGDVEAVMLIVRHGPMGSDGFPTFVRAETLPDAPYDIENLPDGFELIDRSVVNRLTAERDEALEFLENLRHWRDLALQFDNHRLQALWHLKALLQSQEHVGAAHEFLESPPMAAHEVTAERDGLLARLEESTVDCEANRHEREVVCANYEVLKAELTKARELLRRMTNNYAYSLEAGHDRITFLGGDCDSVEKMLDDNRHYSEACAFLATSIAHNADENCGQDAEAAKGEQS